MFFVVIRFSDRHVFVLLRICNHNTSSRDITMILLVVKKNGLITRLYWQTKIKG